MCANLRSLSFEFTVLVNPTISYPLDESVEIRDVVRGNLLFDLERFEDVEAAKGSFELRSEDPNEVRDGEFLKVEEDGFAGDRSIGRRRDGSKTLFDRRLGAVENALAFGLEFGRLALLCEFDHGLATLMTKGVTLTAVGLRKRGEVGRRTLAWRLRSVRS